MFIFQSHAGLTQTVERAKGPFDFSIVLFREVFTLLAPIQPKYSVTFWAYLHIFGFTAWLACLAALVVTAFQFFVIDWSNNNKFYDGWDAERFTIVNGFGKSSLQRNYCFCPGLVGSLIADNFTSYKYQN